MPTSRLLGTLLVLLPCAAGAADLGTVSWGDDKAALTSLCAYEPRYDMQGWGRPEMTLLLSDKPLDCAALQGWANPESGAFDAAVHTGRGALLSISTKDGLKLGRVSFYAVGATLGNDDCAGCATTLAPGGKGVKGTIKSTKPLMLNDTPIAFDVALDFAKPAAPAAGEKLGPGGGDPGKAYAAYIKAYQDGDYAALQKLMPEGKAEEEWGYYDDEAERKKQIQSEDKWKSVTIVDGWRFGDSAILVAEVPHPWREGSRMKAAIGLALANGSWRVREERADMGGTMFGR